MLLFLLQCLAIYSCIAHYTPGQKNTPNQNDLEVRKYCR